MAEILVKNGFVVDPTNKIDGEKMDIAIKDGKIVKKVNERKAKIIDASGLTVMAGGVDIHSHIAGAEVNMGRLIRPEDHYKDAVRKTKLTRSGTGYSIPSTFVTGYRYSTMGYTTVMNGSFAPLKAKHVHEELNDIPLLDKGTYPLLGDWWFVLENLAKGDIEECARHVAWMMQSTKGYAIKVVNPGGLESWGFGHNVHSIDDQVPNFCITPREIVRGLIKVDKMLNLPHTIHLHTNNLGQPGNYKTTLDTMRAIEDLSTDGKPVAHITHIQFASFAGDDWGKFRSGADEISKYINAHNHITLDMGQVIFTDTTTMTADGPFEYTLYTLSGHKWVNSDVETEASGGIIPFTYKKNNAVNAIQWSIGLEIALLVKDPWKIFMTTDHPNGGPFMSYPRVLAWLMSKKAREATLKRCHKKAQKKSLLPSIDRELSLYELAIVTRAGTAKALGMPNKGHLGVGADGDVAIFNINPETTDIAKKYKAVRKAFKESVYTIKDGKIVAKDGEVVDNTTPGRTMWVDVKTKQPCIINEEMKRKFREYWSIEYENYPVSDHYVKVSDKLTVEASV
ncbi:MAG: formylmethanofuran dehydrogenase subunit A [Candidatus Bathyarchaeota archaeon]|nr:formylmethanofuran dehydrogenase subunit A [Candidatus Bathyarchaeota archaeon]MDD4326051.1 formylmethanofuran dehydrogenase subunit A [Candidatus Bathyarchaeota archaeon]MDI9578709.1 formylmethanofuran dehydrogenase subunit A [Thermoproteota archaeon]NLD66267.1 formylmethanofuran dehydrogenase subunit A [Thermoproteota archaeon]